MKEFTLMVRGIAATETEEALAMWKVIEEGKSRPRNPMVLKLGMNLCATHVHAGSPICLPAATFLSIFQGLMEIPQEVRAESMLTLVYEKDTIDEVLYYVGTGVLPQSVDAVYFYDWAKKYNEEIDQFAMLYPIRVSKEEIAERVVVTAPNKFVTEEHEALMDDRLAHAWIDQVLPDLGMMMDNSPEPDYETFDLARRKDAKGPLDPCSEYAGGDCPDGYSGCEDPSRCPKS